MLTELTVSNLAIVRQLHMRWERGLSIITGETGAGKSIIVDAISALAGGRVSPDMVHSGAPRAIVEGVFELPTDSDAVSAITAILGEIGLEPEDGVLIVTREIASEGGRGVSRINGRAVPIAVIQRLGEWLVDIHGQSEHLSLLRSREQLELLDRYAGNGERRLEMATLVRDLRRIRQERLRLEEDVRKARREESILRHEVGEIEAAGLDAEEESDLKARRDRLRNAERLHSTLAAAVAALSGDDEQPGAADLVGQAGLHVREAARFDESLTGQADSLEGAAEQVTDALHAINDSLEQLAEEAVGLESVEERVLQIADLKRKYGESIEIILEYLEDARARLDRLERHDILLQDLADQQARVASQVASCAKYLSDQRHVAAEALSVAVQSELADLAMRGTTFTIEIRQEPSSDGLAIPGLVDDQMVAVDETGADRVELLIAPNPGEPPRPLARIASGGELARVSLALKTVLSQVDTRATLVFDEVDVGVGGRSAGVVGEKLWDLTRHHQVLCITHMPQVAAFADSHLQVHKSASSDATDVQVTPLHENERAEELAAMLGGVNAGSAALASARELLERAATRKAARSVAAKE